MPSPGKPMVPKPSSLGISATAANKWRKQPTTLMSGQLLNSLPQLGIPTLTEISRRLNKSSAVLLDSLLEITTAPVAWQIWWALSTGHLSKIVDSTAAWWWCTRSITTWSTSKQQNTMNSEATNPGSTDHILTLQHTPLHSSQKPSGIGITSWRPSYLHIPQCLQDCIEGSPTEVISSQPFSFYLLLVYNAPCSSSCHPWDEACVYSSTTYYLLLLEASTIQGERKENMENLWKFEGKIRKVELLPTWDCEAGYGTAFKGRTSGTCQTLTDSSEYTSEICSRISTKICVDIRYLTLDLKMFHLLF